MAKILIVMRLMSEKEELMDTEESLNKPKIDSESDLSEEIQHTETLENNEKIEAKEESLLAAEKERYLRLYSEFENFKRRSTKERFELFSTASKDIIVALLPVLDDLERALKASSSVSDELKNELEGFELIQKKLVQILDAKGLKPIDSLNNQFDVDFHEAITKIPAPTDELKGKVVDEVEKGYTLNGTVIRFSKVVVGE